MQFTEGKLGRTFILRLQDGDRLPAVLEEFAAEKKVASALCFLLGGMKGGKVVVGPVDGNEVPLNPMVRLLNGVHEVFGIGTLFADEKGNQNCICTPLLEEMTTRSAAASGWELRSGRSGKSLCWKSLGPRQADSSTKKRALNSSKLTKEKLTHER